MTLYERRFSFFEPFWARYVSKFPKSVTKVRYFIYSIVVSKKGNFVADFKSVEKARKKFHKKD
jgi:hypothetical protein